MKALKTRGGNQVISILPKHYNKFLDALLASGITKIREGFAGALKKEDRKKFDKGRRKQSEVLGYTLTGTNDVKTEIDDATVHEA